MGNQPNALELARQRNTKAIATLLNRSLQPHGIKALVRRKGDCLHIVLDAAQVPKQQTMVRFVSGNLAKLKIASVHTVKIYGRQLGQDFPAWSKALVLPAENGPETSTSRLPLHGPPKNQPSTEAVNIPSPIRAEQTQIEEAAIAPSPAQIASHSHEPNVNKPRVKSGKFSNPLGRALITALTIQISFDAVLAIFSLAQFTAYAAFEVLNGRGRPSIAINLAALIVNWIENLWELLRFTDIGFLGITTTIFLVWLYRLQVRLKSALPQYPITPWGAVVRFALPFYNCWGIWTLLTKISNHLKSWTQTARWGIALRWWSPWYYAAWLISWILQQTDWIIGRLDIDPPWFEPVLYVMSLVLSLLMLKLVKILHRANSHLKQPHLHRKPNPPSLANRSETLPLGLSIQNRSTEAHERPKSKVFY